MSASMSPPPLSAVSAVTTVDSPQSSTAPPHPETASPQSPLSSPLTRQISISGLEVAFESPSPKSPSANTDDKLPVSSSGKDQVHKIEPTATISDPSSAPEALAPNHDDIIPIANQDPQDPASAPEIAGVNPLFSIIGPDKGAQPPPQQRNVNDNLDDNGDPNPLIQPDLPAYSRGVTPIPTGSVPPANGQIRERKVEDAEWNNGLFECLSRFDLLCESIFCPCVLAGRTHTRLTKPDDDEFTACNRYCCHCCALIFPIIIFIPLWCLPMSANRRELRFKYGLKGSHYGDLCTSLCCPCCVLVQEELEVVGRMKSATNNTKGGRNEGYRRPTEEMTYVNQAQDNV